MTRTKTIDVITLALPKLDDERLDFLADLVTEWSTIFDSLDEPHRAAIRRAMDRMKAGHKIPPEQMFDAMGERIAAAGL